jgi:hypothetical protein
MNALLALPFLLISYTGFAYAGLEGVQIYQEARPQEKTDADPSGGEGDTGSKRHFSYAELCPLLPDPQEIGYGLGDLFEHDGAVEAGCGEAAQRVGDATWVSPGFCGTELRSLGVVGEGREPLLLYGAPARAAWREARDRNLRFAEASELAGGEVALLGLSTGTTAFTRSSPALQPGHRDARRCEEIDEVARPFVKLTSPLPRLWLDYMAAENEWIWPETSKKGDVIFTASDGVPAYGSCIRFVCRLDGPGLHRSLEGIDTVRLDQLELYASVGGER